MIKDLPENIEVKMNEDILVLNNNTQLPSGDSWQPHTKVEPEEIKAVVYTEDNILNEPLLMFYSSTIEKSESLRIKTTIINPTAYKVYPRLVRWDYKNKETQDEDFSGNQDGKELAKLDKFQVLQENAEVEQGECNHLAFINSECRYI